MTDFDELDVKLHPFSDGQRMKYSECVRWINTMKMEILTLRSEKKAGGRMLAVIKGLVEKTSGFEAKAVELLRENGVVPLEKKAAPPVDQQRKEFLEFYESANPKQREQLETSVKEANDTVLLAEIAKVKGSA